MPRSSGGYLDGFAVGADLYNQAIRNKQNDKALQQADLRTALEQQRIDMARQQMIMEQQMRQDEMKRFMTAESAYQDLNQKLSALDQNDPDYIIQRENLIQKMYPLVSQHPTTLRKLDSQDKLFQDTEMVRIRRGQMAQSMQVLKEANEYGVGNKVPDFMTAIQAGQIPTVAATQMMSDEIAKAKRVMEAKKKVNEFGDRLDLMRAKNAMDMERDAAKDANAQPTVAWTDDGTGKWTEKTITGKPAVVQNYLDKKKPLGEPVQTAAPKVAGSVKRGQDGKLMFQPTE